MTIYNFTFIDGSSVLLKNSDYFQDNYMRLC